MRMKVKSEIIEQSRMKNTTAFYGVHKQKFYKLKTYDIINSGYVMEAIFEPLFPRFLDIQKITLYDEEIEDFHIIKCGSMKPRYLLFYKEKLI